MTAWERLSVPLNNRYWIWSTGGAETAVPVHGGKRGSLLALPPSAWLGGAHSAASAQIGILKSTSLEDGVPQDKQQPEHHDAAAATSNDSTAAQVAVAMSTIQMQAAPLRRRPMFYCQSESGPLHSGTRAKNMLEAQFAAPARASARLAALEAAEAAAELAAAQAKEAAAALAARGWASPKLGARPATMSNRFRRGSLGRPHPPTPRLSASEIFTGTD